MTQAYCIEKLDKHKHDRTKFKCGIDVLDVYLQMKANQEQKKHLNVTYVAVPSRHPTAAKPIAGYYTLSNSAICLSSMPDTLKKAVPPTYSIPTLKIGRLAVDNRLHRSGIGGLLLRDACLKAIEIATLSGIKGIEVMAKNESAVSFYEQFGFNRLQDAQHMLFMPTETLLNI